MMISIMYECRIYSTVVLIFQHDHEKSVFIGNLPFGELSCAHVILVDVFVE